MANHLYEMATGRLVSSTVLDIPDIPSGMAVKASDKTGTWDETLLDFIPSPPVTRLSKDSFYRRVGLVRFKKIQVAAKTDDQVAAFMGYIKGLSYIDLASSDIDLGLTYLQTSGVLNSQDVQEIKNV